MPFKVYVFSGSPRSTCAASTMWDTTLWVILKVMPAGGASWVMGLIRRRALMGLNNSVMWTHSLMPVCGKHPNRKQWNIKNLFFWLLTLERSFLLFWLVWKADKQFKRSLEPLRPTSLFLCNYTSSITKSRREAQQRLANSVSIWQPFCFTFVTSWSHATNPIHLGIQTWWKDGLLMFKLRIFTRGKEWCKWHWTRLVPDELVHVFQKMLLCWDLIYIV